MAQRGLHLAEVIELGLGAVAGGVFLGVRHVFLGILDGAVERVSLELNEVDCRLGEHGEAGWADLGKAAAHEIAAAIRAAEIDLEQPRTKAREQGRVTGEHGEIALRPRHQNLLDIGGDK